MREYNSYCTCEGEEMNRFIEKLHSLFYCDAEVLGCSEYVYISPCEILSACAFRSGYSYI